MLDESQLVNTDDAAALCGVTRRGFYYLLGTEGAPKPVRFLGKVFYRRDALAEWNGRRPRRKKGGQA